MLAWRLCAAGFSLGAPMSFWKKIGKGIKKILPYAGAAASLVPGVGSAIGGVISKVGEALGGGSSAQSNAPPPDPRADENGIGTSPDRVNVTGQRDAAPPWMGMVSAAAPLAAGALSFLGQRNANVANAKQAQSQMDFQNQQTSSSWQRGVADMKAAGLNPMLAYSQGGAGSGTGSSAVMGSELGAGANAAQSAYLARQQMQQSAATIENLQSSSALNDSQASATDQSRLESIARTRNLSEENRRILSDIYRLDLHNELTKRTMESAVSQASSASELARIQADLHRYRLPEERSKAHFFERWGNEYQTTSRAAEVANSATSAIGNLWPKGLFNVKFGR